MQIILAKHPQLFVKLCDAANKVFCRSAKKSSIMQNPLSADSGTKSDLRLYE